MKGATWWSPCNDFDRPISIHAPVKGATPIDGKKYTVRFVISIHAPVKGATTAVINPSPSWNHFNPRTREGCDLTGLSPQDTALYFNPRTREGCDYPLFWTFAKSLFVISIHAPVKGATFEAAGSSIGMHFISIHAPVKGAT